MSYQFGGLSALISKKEPDPETTSKLVVKEFKLKTINEAKQQRQIAQEKVQTQSSFVKHKPAEFPKKIKKPRHKPRIPISNIESQINEVEDTVTSKSSKTKDKKENEAPADSNKNKKRKLEDTATSEELTTEATENIGIKVKKNKNKRKKDLKEKPEETDTSPQVNEEVLGSEVKSKKKKKSRKESIKDESTEKENGNIEDSNKEIEKEVGDLGEPKKKIVDPEADDKTIFVGNWPVNKVKKHLKKYFIRYGDIEAVRFRSVPLSDTRISKKVTAITKQFHPDRTSTNAYVRFTTKDSAIKALQANGTSIDNHHLRVTLCNATEHDLSKSVFLGNIQFQTEDEDLWKLFGDCGDIESVRIVRDSKTGISKGIGYVNFRSKDGVELALKMDGADLKGRPVRIKRISNNVKRQKEKEERIKKEQISNSEAYQLRREKKDKKFQGVKLAPKTKNKKKKTKRLQKSKVSFKPFVQK